MMPSASSRLSHCVIPSTSHGCRRAPRRVADRVTGFLGSWRFLVIQTILVVQIWIAGNVILLFHFDPYPFILLNLAFDAGGIRGAPDPAGRQSDRDAGPATLEHAAAEGDLEEKQNEGTS